jgi:acetolactate synthase small subunit
MRGILDQTADINRALVGSVFFHLFFLAMALYLPKYQPPPPTPVSIFEVQLVEAPQIKKSEGTSSIVSEETKESDATAKPVAPEISDKPIAPPKPAQEPDQMVIKPTPKPKKLAEVKPIVKPLSTLSKVAPKKLAKVKPVVKPLEALQSKAIEQKKVAIPPAKPIPKLADEIQEVKIAPIKTVDNKTLDLLNKIETKNSPNENRIKELDQVASLQIKKPEAKNDSTLSDNLKALEKVREEKAVETLATSAKPVPVEPLKIEPLKSVPPAEMSPLEKLSALEDLSGKETLAALKQPEKSADLLAKAEIPKLAPLTLLKENKSDALDSVAQKFADRDTLKPSQKLEILQPVQSPVTNKEFSSKLREVEISVSTTVVIPESARSSVAGSGNVSSSDMANIQALYVKSVEAKIMSMWKNPLASEDKEVQASFYIYRAGTIDPPRVTKKSGNGKLDSLAVQAILDAEPFSEFPKELALTNMHLTINFKYKLDKK